MRRSVTKRQKRALKKTAEEVIVSHQKQQRAKIRKLNTAIFILSCLLLAAALMLAGVGVSGG